jgi:hypothetical protein
MPDIGWAGIGTMSWLELIWLLSGLCGALNYWYLVLNVTGDRKFVYAQEKRNELREVTAEMSWWTEVTHFAILCGYAGVGIVAGTMAPSNVNRIYNPASITITVVFFGSTLALTALGIQRRRWRNHLYEIEERQATALQKTDMWNSTERRTP